MIKKNRVFTVLIVLLLVLSSCSTSIKLSYMKPSKVNMGSYKNIAIASTVPYSGKMSSPIFIRSLTPLASSLNVFSTYDSNLNKNVANYATNKLYSTISKTNFFENILEPKKTDTILGMDGLGYDASKVFIEQGYDAVMIPKIESMTYDEYIWSEEKNVKVFDKKQNKDVIVKEITFRVKMIAYITYSITVVDCRANKVVARETFEDSYTWTSKFDPKYPTFIEKGEDLFRSMISDFQSDILSRFVPAKASYTINLMKNKPKLEAVEPAYKMAKENNMAGATALFKEGWEDYDHIPSGYNYALLLAGYGEYDEALAVLEELRMISSDYDISRFYGDLLNMKKKNEEALSQIEGTAPTPGGSSSSIYDFILN